jgi:hypothetical protein
VSPNKKDLAEAEKKAIWLRLCRISIRSPPISTHFQLTAHASQEQHRCWIDAGYPICENLEGEQKYDFTYATCARAYDWAVQDLNL